MNNHQLFLISIQEQQKRQIEEGWIKGLATAALDIGSAAASMIPVVGTAVGAGLGAVSGYMDYGWKGALAGAALGAVPGGGAMKLAGKYAIKAGAKMLPKLAMKAAPTVGKVTSKLGGKFEKLQKFGNRVNRVVTGVNTLRQGADAIAGPSPQIADAGGMRVENRIYESIGERMNYLDKVKKTVQNMKPDNSVIHQQVDQKANTGDRSKSIKVEEPFKAIKPKLFRNTNFNPKNVGSEGY